MPGARRALPLDDRSISNAADSNRIGTASPRAERSLGVSSIQQPVGLEGSHEALREWGQKQVYSGRIVELFIENERIFGPLSQCPSRIFLSPTGCEGAARGLLRFGNSGFNPVINFRTPCDDLRIRRHE